MIIFQFELKFYAKFTVKTVTFNQFAFAKAQKKLTAFTKYFKSEKLSPGLGKDSGRFETFGPNRQIFFYPRVPPCRANFLSIRPRIKFLYRKLIN